jgi:hypothetical protein
MWLLPLSTCRKVLHSNSRYAFYKPVPSSYNCNKTTWQQLAAIDMIIR